MLSYLFQSPGSSNEHVDMKEQLKKIQAQNEKYRQNQGI